MKPQYDTLVLSSFRVWLDHLILQKGSAFSNKNLVMYETEDEDYANKSTYSAPEYQWVYDSSISGATVPTGVLEGVTPVSRGTDGLILDFQNGRAIFDDATHVGVADMSINASVKEVNTYMTTQAEQQLVHEVKHEESPDLLDIEGPMEPNQILSPCVFIRLIKRENDPAALGGLDWSKLHLRCICFGSDWIITSLSSIFTDAKNTNIPIFDAADLPFDEYNDLKGGSFDYDSLVSTSYNTPEKIAFIEEVVFSTYENDSLSDNNPKIRMAFGEFTITKGRYPRSN